MRPAAFGSDSFGDGDRLLAFLARSLGVSRATSVGGDGLHLLLQAELAAEFGGAIDGEVGDTWDKATFTAKLDLDTVPFRTALGIAWATASTWSTTTFTAKLTLDTSAVYNAIAAVDQFLPHSPAKKGPLSRVPSFDYIADSFAASMRKMQGMVNMPKMAPAPIAPMTPARPSYGSGYGGRGGGTTIINQTITNHNTVKVDDLPEVIEAVDFINALPKERQLMSQP